MKGGRPEAGRRQAGRDGQEHEDHEEGTGEAIRTAEVEGRGREAKAGEAGEKRIGKAGEERIGKRANVRLECVVVRVCRGS